jgi:hypothetical protein
MLTYDAAQVALADRAAAAQSTAGDDDDHGGGQRDRGAGGGGHASSLTAHEKLALKRTVRMDRGGGLCLTRRWGDRVQSSHMSGRMVCAW